MEEFSMMDAFKALKDVSDDIIYTTPKKTGKIGANRNRKLDEAITVDLNSSISKEDAAEAVKEATEKVEKPITIVDVNADTLEHVKDKVEYVGQVILKCKKCQGLKFVDMDKIVASEIKEGDNEIEVFNIEDECPTCHSEGAGFEIVGQVAQVPEEKEEETISNDNTPTEAEAAEKVEDEETEELEKETVEEPEKETEEETAEVDDEETEEEVAEDDTTEMTLPKLGDLIDEDEVKEDDTETNESLEDGKLRGLLNGLNESDGEVFKEEEEVFDFEKPLEIDDSIFDTVEDYVEENREACRGKECEEVEDFFSYIIDPEDIEICEIYSLDDDPKLLYQGTCSEIPETFKKGRLAAFDTAGSLLLVNVGDEKEDGVRVGDVIKFFNNEDEEVICITDQESGEELICGKRSDVLDQFKNREFISVEAPKALVLYVRPDTKVEEIVKERTPKDELLHEIFDVNKNLSVRRLNDSHSLESWINEALIEKEHDDLDNIYSSFIRPTHNRGLIEKFKSFTGYKDALDIIQEEFSDLTETKAKNDNENDSIEQAKEILKNNPKCIGVIYGYKNTQGKFFAIDPIVCDTDRELEFASRKVELENHAKGLVRVLYNKAPIEEEVRVDETEESEGIRKLKRMIGPVAANENMSQGTDDENNNNKPLSEETEEKEFVEVTDKDYFFDDETGEIHLRDDFGIEKIGDYINLKFIDDNDEKIYTYRVIEKKEEENMLPWTLEYVSEQDTFLNDLDESTEIEIVDEEGEEVAPTELITKWADRDRDAGKTMSIGIFTEECKKEDIVDLEDVHDLYDLYLEKIGYTTESLVESVDENHKLNPYDEIEIKINGEVVSTGTVKDTFNEDSLEDFYEKFTVQNGVFVAQEGNEKWEVSIIKKVTDTEPSTTEQSAEDAVEEVSEQLKKEIDPDKIAVLQNERATAEKEMEYCDDHNDPRGAVQAAKEIDRIDEVKSFKTRRELGEAIERCKAEGRRYKVSRSTNEDYRYDLILIPSECQEPCEEVPEEQVCPICGKLICDCSNIDFDTDAFESDMNDYLSGEAEEPVVLTIREGRTDNSGSIILEGIVKSNETEMPIKFLLTPKNNLTEGLDKDKIVYTVTNNLSEEVFEFSFDK